MLCFALSKEVDRPMESKKSKIKSYQLKKVISLKTAYLFCLNLHAASRLFKALCRSLQTPCSLHVASGFTLRSFNSMLIARCHTL